MDYSKILGILIVTGGNIGTTFGLFVVYSKVYKRKKRLLLCSSLAVLLWIFGIALTVVAANQRGAMIGYIIATLGWAPFPALMLHFTLKLTGIEDKLDKRFAFFMYIPSLLMVYASSILPIMGRNLNDLVDTKYGWTMTYSPNGWLYFYYIYHIGYAIINLIILLKEGKKHKEKKQGKLSSLLITGYIVIYFLKIATFILVLQHGMFLPRVEFILSLIAIYILFYVVYRLGQLDTGVSDPNQIILNDKVSSDVYNVVIRVLLLCSCVGAIIVLLIWLLGHNQIEWYYNIIKIAIILFAVSGSLYALNRLKLGSRTKELLVAISVSIVIPSATLMNIEYGSVSVWAFIFLFIIICLVYDRKLLLISVSTASLMSQLLVWGASPSVLVEINSKDYIARIGIISVAIIVSVFVNNVYIKKLKQNAYYLEKQELLYDISVGFEYEDNFDLEEIIYDILKKSGTFLSVEMGYFILFDKELKRITCSKNWTRQDSKIEISEIENVTPDMIEIISNQLEAEKIAVIEDTNPGSSFVKNNEIVDISTDYNGTKSKDKDAFSYYKEKLTKDLREANIRGLINAPIKDGRNKNVIGFIGFSSEKPLKEWNIDSYDFTNMVANSITDLISRAEVREKIYMLAYYDQGTKLPNQVFFKEKLREKIKQAKEKGTMVAVVFADIDSFKSINDTMGHEFGDKVLYQVAQIISDNIRDEDIPGRFGGDEFTIALVDITSEDQIVSIMDRITAEIRKPFYTDNQEIFITISAGIAIYPKDGTDTETLVKNADTALYSAKTRGKDKYVFCSQEMKNRNLKVTQLTNDLYKSIEKDQLLLHYQPQIDLKTKEIVGFEALVRWKHPSFGMISPGVFIPLAEKSGFIHQVGAWVLEEACRQCKAWQDEGFIGPRIAVNISVYQLSRPDFVLEVDNTLKKTGLASEYLELEITERAAIRNVEQITDTLISLKDLGVSISIDDFGTEYSSISWLKNLSIDRIKMDIQFVNGIEGSNKDQIIAKFIVNLAKDIEMEIIAEGVETKAQLDFLTSHHCDEGQGYYFYRPMPADQIEKTIIHKKI